MSRDHLGRFLPNQPSPNPKGRPPKYPGGDALLLLMLSELVTLKQNGIERQLTAAEAMLLRAVEEIMKGKPSISTMRLVLNAIVEWEVARYEQASPMQARRKAYLIQERDSDNAFEAMCLLGIAQPNPDYPQYDEAELPFDGSEILPNYSRIQLLKWAVEAAQARAGELPSDPDWWIKLDYYTAKSQLPS